MLTRSALIALTLASAVGPALAKSGTVRHTARGDFCMTGRTHSSGPHSGGRLFGAWCPPNGDADCNEDGTCTVDGVPGVVESFWELDADLTPKWGDDETALADDPRDDPEVWVEDVDGVLYTVAGPWPTDE